MSKLTAMALLIPLIGVSFCVSAREAASGGIIQIGNVIIPQVFSEALSEGMTIPILLHFEQNSGVKDDQRIGNAQLYLADNRLKIRQLSIDDRDDLAQLSPALLKK